MLRDEFEHRSPVFEMQPVSVCYKEYIVNMFNRNRPEGYYQSSRFNNNTHHMMS